MRPAAVVASTILVASIQAHLLPFFQPSKATSRIQRSDQQPMADQAPGIQLPPSSSDNPPASSDPKGDVILSDVIGSQRQIQIFAGFTRDVSTVSDRLDASSLNTTVLAPSNSAIQALPRKPWEDPDEYQQLGPNAYSGQAGEDRAARNMRRFTEAHIVPAAPWKEGEKAKTMGGSEVWWEEKEGRRVVQPGEVEVEKVVSRVANGEVWMLKRVLNYAS